MALFLTTLLETDTALLILAPAGALCTLDGTESNSQSESESERAVDCLSNIGEISWELKAVGATCLWLSAVSEPKWWDFLDAEPSKVFLWPLLPRPEGSLSVETDKDVVSVVGCSGVWEASWSSWIFCSLTASSASKEEMWSACSESWLDNSTIILEWPDSSALTAFALLDESSPFVPASYERFFLMTNFKD